MKIVAGLGSVDEYIRFAEAGADEFFCGYVPYEWSREYGTALALNRREVLNYQVQLGSFSELEILAKLVRAYGRPVHLAFNSLYYIPEQYPKIASIVKKCQSLGFETFIVADPALFLYLRREKIDCKIHLSGETGEVNREMLAFFRRFGLQRLIFHRKNTLEDMASVIRAGVGLEFEAFVLNELCQFTGAFCNSLHCDELGHLCRVPYELGRVRGKLLSGNNVNFDDEALTLDEEGYLCGATGCGLCALYAFQRAGITHLKLVGRGNHADFMEKDIRNLRKALDIMEGSSSEADFRKEMKRQLFPRGCSGNCYYAKSSWD